MACMREVGLYRGWTIPIENRPVNNLNFLTCSSRLVALLSATKLALETANAAVPSDLDAMLFEAQSVEGSRLYAVTHRWKYGNSELLVRMEADSIPGDEPKMTPDELIGRKLMTLDPKTYDMTEDSGETIDVSRLSAEDVIDVRGVALADV